MVLQHVCGRPAKPLEGSLRGAVEHVQFRLSTLLPTLTCACQFGSQVVEPLSSISHVVVGAGGLSSSAAWPDSLLKLHLLAKVRCFQLPLSLQHRAHPLAVIFLQGGLVVLRTRVLGYPGIP